VSLPLVDAATPAPVVVAPDFSPLLVGCGDAQLGIATLDGEIVVLVVRAKDAHMRVTILGETSRKRRTLEAPVGDSDVRSFDEARTSGTWDDPGVTLVGDCAPDLEERGQPINCTETTVVARAGRGVVSSKRPLTDNFIAPPAEPPPADWKSAYDAWRKRSPKCALSRWSMLAPDIAFVRAAAASTCDFGAGAIVQRAAGAMRVAVAAGDDGTLVVLDAEHVKYVAQGVDARFESMWRVAPSDGGFALATVTMPGVANEAAVVGGRVWLHLASGPILRLERDAWQGVDVCTHPSSLESRGDRAIVTCDGAIVVARNDLRDAIRFEPPNRDVPWRALTLAGRDETWLVDDRNGTIVQSRYVGAPLTCE